MKVLYAIQGTGNGHLSRARDIVPILQKQTSLDILVSGTQADITLPYSHSVSVERNEFLSSESQGA